jgi:hypothetical protein
VLTALGNLLGAERFLFITTPRPALRYIFAF